MVTTTNRWRFIETDYARMRDHVIFGAGDSVALVDGEMAVQPARETARQYRFTAAQYELLGEFGILNEDARVELIGGRSSR